MNFKLFTAGPVQVPQYIQQEIAKPILYHRDSEFILIFNEVVEGIKYILQTRNDVLIFTASGTGGMEAVVTNLFSKNDRVLVIEQGKFSARWTDICLNYGLSVERLKLSWRESVTTDQIKKLLNNIKAVLLTHCETSTGALNDLQKVAKAIHENSKALVIVDAISTVAAVPFKMDEWGIDVAVASSNKGLMNPPGLVIIALNSITWQYVQQAKLPRYYFSFKKTREAFLSGIGSPFTPSIPLIRGIHRRISEIKQNGLENLWHQLHILADAVRTAIRRMDLEIWPYHPSDSITVIKIAPPLDNNKILTLLKQRYNIVLSKGQGELKDKVIRIGHFGEIEAKELAEVISALESILIEMGWNIPYGTGVRAFYDCLSANNYTNM